MLHSGKPKKIKKKKSFMFTSRHPSELGTLSALLAIASVVSLITSVMLSFADRGDTPINLGGAGLFSFLANIIGIIAGFLGLNERDIYIWPVRIAIAANIIVGIIWAVLVIWGTRL